eukprot:493156_1
MSGQSPNKKVFRNRSNHYNWRHYHAGRSMNAQKIVIERAKRRTKYQAPIVPRSPLHPFQYRTLPSAGAGYGPQPILIFSQSAQPVDSSHSTPKSNVELDTDAERVIKHECDSRSVEYDHDLRLLRIKALESQIKNKEKIIEEQKKKQKEMQKQEDERRRDRERRDRKEKERQDRKKRDERRRARERRDSRDRERRDRKEKERQDRKKRDERRRARERRDSRDRDGNHGSDRYRYRSSRRHMHGSTDRYRSSRRDRNHGSDRNRYRNASRSRSRSRSRYH